MDVYNLMANTGMEKTEEFKDATKYMVSNGYAFTSKEQESSLTITTLGKYYATILTTSRQLSRRGLSKGLEELKSGLTSIIFAR